MKVAMARFGGLVGKLGPKKERNQKRQTFPFPPSSYLPTYLITCLPTYLFTLICS